ncbi:hypothetical protein [Dickeya solani]|uniref:4-hydroxy-tetrahydrodipicolinate synthase n=2 Tax=Dickeya solani TaxID=1089444 RepID=A0AAP3D8M9_9GAMM|nr:hypothetical protein [Dickeya solani]AYQ49195.1 hypothetical protein CTB91_03440 [Dickeya solani]AYQ53358.1 hypothetical protein DSOL99_03437 [Dickeya solani]ERO56795.1 hypothetical protein A544_3368 [Dickeya solani D s0432-1]MBD3604696.1 dihydrodipicolinate synthase family protein [Dickeya solani]MBJ2330681.1 hypothetical protein [Dickeya solani]
MKEITIDLRGLNPPTITPFTRDGAVDYAKRAIHDRLLPLEAGAEEEIKAVIRAAELPRVG